MKATTKPTRRWFSYSLRSLFVLVTLAAIGLGWVAYERRQSQREMEIAEELEANGATVQFGGLFDPADSTDPTQPGNTRWWSDAFVGLVGPRVRRVKLDGNRSLLDLSLLANLDSLEALSLRHTPFWDISPLADLKNLKSIRFEYALVSHLAPLAGLKRLKDLDLNCTQVTYLAPLAGLENLQTLYLDKTGIRDLAPLADLKHLRNLHLSYTQVRDLSPLSGLTSLQVLWLDGTHISDLTPLAGLKDLRELAVKDTEVSEEQVKMLQQALPNCKISSGVTPIPHVVTIPTMPVRPATSDSSRSNQ